MLKRQDATSLVHGDIVRRGISLQTNLGYRSMFFQDDRVHLSQVPINLIINPMDAVDGLWAENNSEFGATFLVGAACTTSHRAPVDRQHGSMTGDLCLRGSELCGAAAEAHVSTPASCPCYGLFLVSESPHRSRSIWRTGMFPPLHVQ
jgi:hypothetical protein